MLAERLQRAALESLELASQRLLSWCVSLGFLEETSSVQQHCAGLYLEAKGLLAKVSSRHFHPFYVLFCLFFQVTTLTDTFINSLGKEDSSQRNSKLYISQQIVID